MTRTLREGKREGSLLDHLDRTLTPMGARLFEESLLAPLTDRVALEARLDAVSELVTADALRHLRQLLAQVPDLHRLGARAGSGRAAPRQLAAVARALGVLPEIRDALAGCQARLLGELGRLLDTCPALCRELLAALADDPPADVREGGVLRDGFDAHLDELRQAVRTGKQWLARYQAEEAARTGIAGLKLGYTLALTWPASRPSSARWRC